jgi:hypothetical protein
MPCQPGKVVTMNWGVVAFIASTLFLTPKLAGQDGIPEITGFGGYFVSGPLPNKLWKNIHLNPLVPG